ncbi:hypothetical protein BPOR_0047g00130 [Botrytis porri]|uniref:Uncharacterized protein n=1 Tax=Botrytis porri TaxID=87229 RepID=A0A4Z1L280_9HELO|nr:hypothetical protein BPOR_0047g00130 [Botrytis porri]
MPRFHLCCIFKCSRPKDDSKHKPTAFQELQDIVPPVGNFKIESKFEDPPPMIHQKNEQYESINHKCSTAVPGIAINPTTSLEHIVESKLPQQNHMLHPFYHSREMSKLRGEKFHNKLGSLSEEGEAA